MGKRLRETFEGKITIGALSDIPSHDQRHRPHAGSEEGRQMTTLAELKRCPKCNSADISWWHRGSLPDCWHCHDCLENFTQPLRELVRKIDVVLSTDDGFPDTPSKQREQVGTLIDAYADSLIETAIERCAQIADQEFMSYHDAANKIRRLTPASIKESCRAKGESE